MFSLSSFKNSSYTKGVKEKTSYYKGTGLFLFISVFTVTNVQADNKQDIAEVEAFYEQVFGKDTQHTKQTLKKLTTQKDPELIAFYNQIFGSSNQYNKAKSSVEKKSSSKTKVEVYEKRQEYLPTPKVKKEILSKEGELQSLIDDIRKPTFRPLLSKEVPAKVKKGFIKKDPELVAFYNLVFGYQNNIKKKPVSHKIIKYEVSTQQKLIYTKDPISRVVDESTTISPAVELQELINKSKNVDSSANGGIAVNNLNDNSAVPKSKKTYISALYSQPFGDTKPIKKQTEEIDKKVSDLDALFAKAFGKKAALSGPSEVSVELKISKRKLGDVKVFRNTQGRLDRVGTRLLLELLNDVLKDHVFKRVEKEIVTKEKITFQELSTLGVGASYNSVELSLDLDINSELRKPLVLSMGTKRKASVRTENKLSADDLSAYLNMYTNIGINSRGSKPEISTKLEGSINIKNLVLESTGNINAGIFTRGRTNLTYDRPEKLHRYMLGDVSTGGKNFQQNLNIKGIRISKEFFMDPNLQIKPSANESIILDSDSDIEVFINNQLRDRFYLRAGIYSLEDIGLYNGANNIRVRIKDKYGKVTIKTSQQYFDSHLLKKGLDLYAVTVGYLSKNNSTNKDKVEKQPIFSAYYRKGLTKTLTMGVDAQISSDSYLLGSEIITPLSMGSIKTGVAFSGGKNKDSGMAARFEFKPNRKPETISLDSLRQEMLGLQKSTKGFLNNWTVSGEVQSKDFSSLTSVETLENISNKKLKANLQTNFSFNISEQWRGALNLGVSDYYDSKESVSAGLSASKRFDNGMSLRLGARYDSEDDYSMNLQLSIPLFRERGKRKKRLALRADTKNNLLSSKLSISPTSFVGKNSLNGSLEHIQSDGSREKNVEVNYRNTSFETNFSARSLSNKRTDDNSQQLNVGFNTSLACVGKRCATSYPINDSFALVSGPSNQERPIALNSNNNRFIYSDDNDSGLPDNYSALISSKNSNAVVSLESYKFQNINIDESTLPDGYDTEKTEFEVFPRYHQGFLIKAGGEPATILDGILVNQENKPLGYKGGQWVPTSGNGKTIAFFSNKAGRFRINYVPTGRYKLELFDYPALEDVNIDVPNLKGKVHDLGALIITE